MQSSSLLRVFLPFSLLGYALAVVANLLSSHQSAPVLQSLPEGATIERSLDQSLREVMPFREAAIGGFGALRYRLLSRGSKGVLVGSDGWLFSTEEVIPQGVDLGIAMMRIVEVADDLRARDVPFLIVAVPTKVDIADAQTIPAVFAPARMLHEGFLEELERAGLPHLDAAPILRGCAQPDRCVFRTDTHWTPHGARKVADAIASAGIGAGKTEFAETALPEDVFFGDLVSFVTTEDFAPRAGIQPETVVPFVAEPPATSLDAADLFAAPTTSEIALLGTSYSADRSWSFAEALKVSLGLDVVNLAQKGLGPWQPMRAFLAGEAAGSTDPIAVIWEIPTRYLAQTAMWDVPS